ncbi:MAG: manganese-dependent inorganic pyrophosphatase [Desulfobulbaceae bacterium]|nr:manganese-dependent inorganic pyrophosphatase [Desulfobulbaceae bacterium]
MSVYVVGHKSPDTDSVTSAIAYAELKKAMGIDAVPAMQGELNPETTMVLDKFGFSAPEVMTDGAGKQLILVDHSDIAQAPDNLSDAEVMEIVDHHKIGDVTTNNPIFFLAQPVGCTGTILQFLYDVNKVEIPKNIAGIMLCAILSDTVLFKSPTCTDADKKACEELAKIAGVSDMEALAMEMFKAKSAVAGVPAKDLVFRDYKDFDMNGTKVGIGQLELVDLSLLDNVRDDLLAACEEIKAEKGAHSIFLILTDIMKEGSDLMVATDDPSVVEKAFGKKMEGKAVWIDGMMSRKKQAVPPLQKVFGA